MKLDVIQEKQQFEKFFQGEKPGGKRRGVRKTRGLFLLCGGPTICRKWKFMGADEIFAGALWRLCLYLLKREMGPLEKELRTDYSKDRESGEKDGVAKRNGNSLTGKRGREFF